VEGWPQLEALRALGCRHAQGYLFAAPEPADACARFLTGRPLRVGDGAAEDAEPVVDTFEDMAEPLVEIPVLQHKATAA
jgi:hypothetical protein